MRASAAARNCCCASRSAPRARSCDLSRKFGCDPEDLLGLARLAADLGIGVRGLSFHVGSQTPDAMKHVEAVQACARLMAAARREKLGAFDTLDIGGGFPIDYAQPVQDIGRFCAPLRAALAEAAAAGARHRRAGALHRRPVRHRRGLGDGARAARGPLVVLPR